MTNQEKDLKNAREYLEENFPFSSTRFLLEPKSKKRKIDTFIELKQILALHVQWLEQKGIVTFTENRNK